MTRLRWTVAIAALLSLSALLFGRTFDLYGRSHGPKGRILNGKPTLVWEVWSTRPGEIVDAKGVLAGRKVEAYYDPSQKRVVAELDRSLPAGRYPVTLSAVLSDGQAITKSWDVEVLSDAIPELPRPSPSQRRTLEAVNRFREGMGLPPFRMDDRLNMASLMHSQYLVQNKVTGHYETPGKPGYVGSEPGDRHEALGWVGDSWETVEFGSDTEEEAVRHLIDAPYHRIPFIQPGEGWLGSGFAGSRLTAAFSMSRERATVMYPFDGQTDVPTLWSFNERPNPLRLHEGLKRPIGYPIMLVAFTKEMSRLKVDSAVLADSGGARVKCALNSPENDTELSNGLILMPYSPLNPGASYTVRVRAELADGTDVSKTWSFRTASKAEAGARGSSSSARRGG